MTQTHQIRYKDCITGKVGAPFDKAGKTIFQIMMVFFMVTVMVTFNWNLHTEDHSPLRFALSLYEYPAMFAIALAIRLLVANPILGRFIDKVVVKHTRGFARGLSITIVNVLFMGTIMGVFGIIVAGGGISALSWELYSSMYPATWIAAFAFNFIVVGPLVKMLYFGFVGPAVEAYRNAASDKRLTAAFHALVGRKAYAEGEAER